MLKMTVNDEFNKKCVENNIEFKLQDKILTPILDKDMSKESFKNLMLVDVKTNEIFYFVNYDVDSDNDAYIYFYDLDDLYYMCKHDNDDFGSVHKDTEYMNFTILKESIVKQEIIPFVFTRHEDKSINHNFAKRFVQFMIKETNEVQRQKKLESIRQAKLGLF